MVQLEEIYVEEIYVTRYTSAGRRGPQPRQALIYFHGFPGPVPGNPNKPVAHRLAEAVVDVGIDVIAPFYRGISPSKGQYQFSGSIEDGKLVLTWTLAQGYHTVSILGYSWGAQVAIPTFLSLDKNRRSKLILMSPATFIPQGESFEELLKEWRDFVPWLLEHVTNAEIMSDILAIVERTPMEKIAKELDPKALHIVQTSDDEVIPQKVTDFFVSLLTSQPASYVKLAGGHNFVDRTRLQKTIRDIFTSS